MARRMLLRFGAADGAVAICIRMLEALGCLRLPLALVRFLPCAQLAARQLAVLVGIHALELAQQARHGLLDFGARQLAIAIGVGLAEMASAARALGARGLIRGKAD